MTFLSLNKSYINFVLVFQQKYFAQELDQDVCVVVVVVFKCSISDKVAYARFGSSVICRPIMIKILQKEPTLFVPICVMYVCNTLIKTDIHLFTYILQCHVFHPNWKSL